MTRSTGIVISIIAFLIALVFAASLSAWIWSPRLDNRVVRLNVQHPGAKDWMDAASVRFPRGEMAVSLRELMEGTQIANAGDVVALLLFVQSELVADGFRGNLFTRFANGLRITFRFPAVLFLNYSFAFIISGEDVDGHHVSIGRSLVNPIDTFGLNSIDQNVQSADISDLASAKVINVKLYMTRRLAGGFPEWWIRPTVIDLKRRSNVECVFSVQVPVWARQ